MYEERRNTFNFKDIILQLLFVVLFVLIMIWLFPTKSYLKDNFVGKEELNSEISEQLQALYGRLFADNIESMKDAAQGYFTNARLPQKVGDSVTLTLEEMLEKKLVLSFKDSNNETCNVTNSYVKVTKMDDEYQMKVQLTCSDFSDYIIVYMGCYDYCDSTICEPSTPNTPVVDSEPEKPTKPTDPETPVVNKKYMYEYRLDTQNTYSNWGDWSNWSTNKITPDVLTQVEIERRTELTGYKTVTYTDYETYTEYRTETTQVQTGTKREEVTNVVDTKPAKGTTTTNKVYGNVIKNTTSGSYTDWVYQGYVTSKYALSNSDTVKYEAKGSDVVMNCNDICKYEVVYKYAKYTRTYNAGKTTYSCPAGYTLEGSGSSTKCYKYVTSNTGQLSCSSYGSDYKLSGSSCIKTETEYKYTPVYETVTTKVPYTVTKEVEKTRQEPIYENITYYRYRTRTQLTVAGTTYKWSTSQNDQSLLNAGYKLTGNKKEV